ncbi:MAG: hypothetical protein ABIC95_03750 [archaeon]
MEGHYDDYGLHGLTAVFQKNKAYPLKTVVRDYSSSLEQKTDILIGPSQDNPDLTNLAWGGFTQQGDFYHYTLSQTQFPNHVHPAIKQLGYDLEAIDYDPTLHDTIRFSIVGKDLDVLKEQYQAVQKLMGGEPPIPLTDRGTDLHKQAIAMYVPMIFQTELLKIIKLRHDQKDRPEERN